jgi:isopentenyl-diphosphate Delta-isomerase
MNRKDDHIQYALAQAAIGNDFDKVHLTHHAFPETNLADVNLSTTLFQRTFPFPFYVNAMTGGSDQAGKLNQRFAKLAKHFQLPMATGSVSAAIKEPSLMKTFSVIREVYPEGFIIANLGAGHPLANAIKAIDLLKANALQIHVNAVQEVVMPEGDKDFQGWLASIAAIRQGIQVPLIVKEVGFGMSAKTFSQLTAIGVQYVDVAGKGGTNFSKIENSRRQISLTSFDDWGQSTVASLLAAKPFTNLQVIASGGIRQPLDVIKSLVLGAKMVGLSGYFLHLIHQYNDEEAIAKMHAFIDELKLIMLLLGKPTIASLSTAEYTYTL